MRIPNVKVWIVYEVYVFMCPYTLSLELSRNEIAECFTLREAEEVLAAYMASDEPPCDDFIYTMIADTTTTVDTSL